MNVVIRELKANLKSLLIWSGSMVFLIYGGMIKYSGIAGAGQEARKLFDQFPPAFKQVLGLGELDITTAAGFYALFYIYFLVLAGVHAVMLGAVIISKEERDKTADFIFVKPVHRRQIVTAKLAAVLINLLVLNLTTLLASVVFVNMYNQGASISSKIALLMVFLFIIQLLFATLGALAAAASKTSKRAVSISTLILMSTFLLSAVIDLYPKIDYLKYLTPFKYFPAVDIIMKSSFSPSMIALSLLLTGTFTFLTYRRMEQRDLHV
ncbi:MAG: ABC transporter permease subunit [Syntrophomonadaceae bacterium]